MMSPAKKQTRSAFVLAALLLSNLVTTAALFGGSSYQRKAQAFGKRAHTENVKRFFPLYLHHDSLYRRLRRYQTVLRNLANMDIYQARPLSAFINVDGGERIEFPSRHSDTRR